MSAYIGIDYSLGKANFDKENGIHYGVISCNSIHPATLEDFETIYPEDMEETDYCDPIGYVYKENGYILEYLETFNAIMVLKSPYKTRSAYCSPCIPGAGDLDAYRVNGVETYCLDPDYFVNGIAPYAIEEVKS